MREVLHFIVNLLSLSIFSVKKNVNLIIEAPLSEPPSEISCFRDVTLYGKSFIFEDIVLSCKKGTRSIYWNWLKSHGAHDFISYLAVDNEIIDGILMHSQKGDFVIDRITSFNLNEIISYFKILRPS